MWYGICFTINILNSTRIPMKTKKYKKVNLENKKFLFFEIGIVLALIIALMAFEWSGKEKGKKNLFAITNDIYIDEITPVTKQKEENPVKPPPPVTILVITPDYVPLTEQLQLPSVEATESEGIVPREPKEEKPVTDNDYVFIRAEEMPKYHGKSYKEFGRFIGQQLHYPAHAAENGVTGIVKVRFIINESGNLVNATVVRSIHEELDNEALRVINLSDRWSPGKQHGKTVKVAFVFPIEFNLTDK